MLAALVSLPLCATGATHEFFVNDTRDLPDTNTLDGVCDGDFNQPGNQCTLRAAVMQGSAFPATDSTSVTLDYDTYGIFGRLFIGGNITLKGQGADSSVVDGSGADWLIQVGNFGDPHHTVVIQDLTLRNGTGYGIMNWAGDLTVTNVEVSGNSGTGVANAWVLRLSDSLITGNTNTSGTTYAGGVQGGISGGGSTTITDSTISGNSSPGGNGGGVALDGSASISGTTISGNSATNGGGIHNKAWGATITNTTISGNTATYGGGVWNEFQWIILNHVTLADNTGGGIYQRGSSTYPGVDVHSSILADNGGNCVGLYPQNIHDDGCANLVTDSTCSSFGGATVYDNEPGLEALGDYGGPTETHALASDSPAIDAFSCAAVGCPAMDQRGAARPYDGDGVGGAVCDLGAYEYTAPVIQPDIAVDPSFHDFGEVLIGSTPTVDIAVTNEGTSDLTIGTLGLDDPLGAPYLIVSDGCSGHVLSSGPPPGACTIGVQFAPVTEGTFDDSFNIPSDDPQEPDVYVVLTGKGVPAPEPDITTDPAENLAFGDVGIGVTAEASVAVTNEGTADLGITAVSIGGADAAEFAQANTCGTLAPAAACAVEVSFMPSTEGAKSASLTIGSDDPDEPAVVIDLTGSGVVVPLPDIDAPESLALGDVQSGGHLSGEVTVTNAGAAALTISAVEMTGDPAFTLASTDCTSGALPPGAGCTCTVDFDPSTVGEKTGALTFVSDDPDEPALAVTLSATSSTDSDGVSDAVEDGAPNGGDGNGDGTPDSAQANVASLPGSAGAFLTLEAPDGTGLAEVAVVDNPSPEDAPAGVDFSHGILGFRVQGVSGPVALTLYLPEEPGSYWQYGPTPADALPHWYEFLYDGATGAQIDGTTVTLHFVDGQRGDHDLTVDGTITDPGGPTWSGCNHKGCPCFIATAAYGSYLHPQVAALRAFRDEHLLGHGAGRALVDAYYRLSPPLAEVIAEHAALRALARAVLTPVVLVVAHPLTVLAILLPACGLLLRLRLRRA